MIKVALLVMSCYGGGVQYHQWAAMTLYSQNQPVELKGKIASACTMLLTAGNVCAHPGTSLHIHATSNGTQPWWLPKKLRARIGKVGQEPVVVRTPELWNYVKRCGTVS